MLDAFNRDDVGRIAAFESCEITEPLDMPDSPATGFRGHDGIRQWMGNAPRSRRSTLRAPELHAERRPPALRNWRLEGLGEGSRVPIEWTTFAVMQMRNGKIMRVRVFLDRARALEAVGLSE